MTIEVIVTCAVTGAGDGWPGIRAGAVLAFTLPRRMWDGISKYTDPAVAAAAAAGRIAVTILALGPSALLADRGKAASDT